MAVSRHGVPSARAVETLEPRRLLADTLGAVIDGNKTYQTIEAIGGAMASLAPRAEYQQASYYNNLAGDLGATAVRAAVSNAFEASNDDNNPDTFNWAKFNDAAIAPAMEFFKQMQARGVKTFLLTYFAPPSWMKTNESFEYGGELRPDLRNEFAENVAAIVKRAQDKWGVPITHVSIANEPWHTEPYQSSMWTPIQYAEALKAVDAKLTKEGLGYVKLVGPEDVSRLPRELHYLNAIENDPAALSALDVWGTHYLNEADSIELAKRVNQDGKNVWYTEVGNGTPDIDGAVGTARGIDSALVKGNATAWINWQFSGSNSFEALMNGNTPNKKYYALKHFARFVRPGAIRLGTQYSGDSVRVAAFNDPAAKSVSIVTSNIRTTAVDLNLKLQGVSANRTYRVFRTTAGENAVEVGSISGTSTLTVNLPANSIVTLYSGPAIPTLTNTTASPATSAIKLGQHWSTTALRRAAFVGDLAGVQARIAAGDSVNAAFGNGWTALFSAAASSFGDADRILTALINAGADVQKRDTEQMTALHIAAMNPVPYYNVPPSVAVERLKVLVAAGVNVNAVDGYGRTALHYAAMLPKINGDMQVLNDDAYNSDMVATLLSLGADKTIVDGSGKRAVDYAVAEGFNEAVPLLQIGGATPTLRPGSIRAFAFDDKNQNAVRDSTEGGLAGVTAYIDTDNDGVLDAGERSAITNAQGQALFHNLQAGNYVVRVVGRSGFVSTSVPTNPINVQSTLVSNATFGVTQIVSGNGTLGTGTSNISGYVINDLNKDGKWTSGEAALANRRVYIDLNANNVFDAATDPWRTTDTSGKYTFAGIPAGSYKLRQELPSGWIQTSPANNGSFGATVAAGATRNNTNLFTVTGTPTTPIDPPPPPPPVGTGTAVARGYVINDLNKDGKWTSGEKGITGRTVWLDLDNDNSIDANEATRTTGANGLFEFTGLNAGTYYVREVIPAGWVQRSPASNAPLTVKLTDGQTKSGVYFAVSNG